MPRAPGVRPWRTPRRRTKLRHTWCGSPWGPWTHKQRTVSSFSTVELCPGYDERSLSGLKFRRTTATVTVQVSETTYLRAQGLCLSLQVAAGGGREASMRGP
jgi:hypothetical protein